MKTKTLNTEVGKGSQSINYEEILEAKTKDGQTHKLRISIKSDSYRHQCHARISRYNGTEWCHLASIHFDKMETENGLHYRPNNSGKQAGHFLEDRRHLITKASMILN